MNYTIVGFFNEKEEAQKAEKQLMSGGFANNQVDLSPFKTQGEYTNADYDYKEDDNTSGFWSWLFDDNDDNRERHSRVAARTNVVTVYAKDKEGAKNAASILDNYGALDVDDYDQKLMGRKNQDINSGKRGDSIEVKKEEMNVGKREVNQGGVQIKSRIVEKPVQENIRLRDERVYVTRKPVDKAVSGKDAFKDKTIEMTERDEKAVVDKSTRVVEEIAVNKDVKVHEEKVSDTVRETEVDIDENFKETDKQRR